MQTRDLHAPATLSRGKISCYALDSRLGGPQSPPRRDGEERNPDRYRDSNPRFSVLATVGLSTEGGWYTYLPAAWATFNAVTPFFATIRLHNSVRQ
jgi:hypothetical protein